MLGASGFFVGGGLRRVKLDGTELGRVEGIGSATWGGGAEALGVSEGVADGVGVGVVVGAGCGAGCVAGLSHGMGVFVLRPMKKPPTATSKTRKKIHSRGRPRFGAFSMRTVLFCTRGCGMIESLFTETGSMFDGVGGA